MVSQSETRNSNDPDLFIFDTASGCIEGTGNFFLIDKMWSVLLGVDQIKKARTEKNKKVSEVIEKLELDLEECVSNNDNVVDQRDLIDDGPKDSADTLREEPTEATAAEKESGTTGRESTLSRQSSMKSQTETKNESSDKYSVRFSEDVFLGSDLESMSNVSVVSSGLDCKAQEEDRTEPFQALRNKFEELSLKNNLKLKPVSRPKTDEVEVNNQTSSDSSTTDNLPTPVVIVMKEKTTRFPFFKITPLRHHAEPKKRGLEGILKKPSIKKQTDSPRKWSSLDASRSKRLRQKSSKKPDKKERSVALFTYPPGKKTLFQMKSKDMVKTTLFPGRARKDDPTDRPTVHKITKSNVGSSTDWR